MRVTVFNGSPRGRASNSHRMVESLLRGAARAGADTEEIYLVERDVGHCHGCFHCWGATPGVCVLKDEMAELLELFLDSDYVGLATPVYGMLMTGMLKSFTDRLLPLATPHIRKNDDGTFYHEGRVKRFPRIFYLANAGFPGGHNFELLKPVVRMLNPVLEVYRNCGEALDAGEEAGEELRARLGEFHEALERAGEELVTRGEPTPETVERLEMELISDEEYMKSANEYWDRSLGED